MDVNGLVDAEEGKRVERLSWDELMQELVQEGGSEEHPGDQKRGLEALADAMIKQENAEGAVNPPPEPPAAGPDQAPPAFDASTNSLLMQLLQSFDGSSNPSSAMIPDAATLSLVTSALASDSNGGNIDPDLLQATLEILRGINGNEEAAAPEPAVKRPRGRGRPRSAKSLKTIEVGDEEGGEGEGDIDDNGEKLRVKAKYYHVYPSYRGGNKYRVDISVGGGVKCYLKAYDDEEEAARLADRAMYYLYGNKAKLNFPNEVTSPLEEEMAAKINRTKEELQGRGPAPTMKEKLQQDALEAARALHQGSELDDEAAAAVAAAVAAGGEGDGDGDEMGGGEDGDPAYNPLAIAKEPRRVSAVDDPNRTKYNGVKKTTGRRIVRFRADLYMAQSGGKRISVTLGTFDDPEEGARLFDRACYYYFGDKNRLNFPEEEPGELEPDLAAKINEKAASVSLPMPRKLLLLEGGVGIEAFGDAAREPRKPAKRQRRSAPAAATEAAAIDSSAWDGSAAMEGVEGGDEEGGKIVAEIMQNLGMDSWMAMGAQMGMGAQGSSVSIPSSAAEVEAQLLAQLQDPETIKMLARSLAEFMPNYRPEDAAAEAPDAAPDAAPGAAPEAAAEAPDAAEPMD